MADRYAPTASDTTVLMSVEDLIGLAMGPSDVNTVNFKIMESVLMVLARQLRILQTRVEVRFGDQTEVSTQLQDLPDTQAAWVESKRRALQVLGRERPAQTVYSVQTSTKGKRPRSRPRRVTPRVCRDASDDDCDTGVCDSETCLQRNLQTIRARGRSRSGGRGPDAVRDAARGRDVRVGSDSTEKKKGKKGASKRGGAENKSGIVTISEKEMKKEKIEVKEGDGSSPPHVKRVGSIEVVTQSEFALLEKAVQELRARGAPPPPSLPDNAQLREELAGGRASLTDAMKAMQVNARIQASEKMIQRLAGIMTQLAASGAIPAELSDQLAKITGTGGSLRTGAEVKGADGAGVGAGVKAGAAAKSDEAAKAAAAKGARAGITGQASGVGIGGQAPGGAGLGAREAPRKSEGVYAPAPGVPNGAGPDLGDYVSHREMDDSLGELRDELLRNLNAAAGQASSIANKASEMAHRVGEKMDVAMKLNGRVTTLQSLVEDYAEQLNGFDSGLSTQLQGFQEQMSQMRSDLADGLKLLEASNTNAETLAVQELRERYESAVQELDSTVHAHGALQSFQWQLAEELQSLLEAVDMLREQKADREEVLDRLRDKADVSRLQGLLTEQDFELAKTQMHEKLTAAYGKFNYQEEVWLGALKDLTTECGQKADQHQLQALRDDAQAQLHDLQTQLLELARAVGEPEAAMLTRQLAKDATCGVCKASAIMPFKDESYGQPPRLPAFRPPPGGAEREECLREVHPPPPTDERTHFCRRWAGGSHTLVPALGGRGRGRAGPLDLHLPPVRNYQALGRDGKNYLLSEELQPCIECNKLGEAECTCVEGRSAPCGPCACAAPLVPPRCACADGDGDAPLQPGFVCEECK